MVALDPRTQYTRRLISSQRCLDLRNDLNSFSNCGPPPKRYWYQLRPSPRPRVSHRTHFVPFSVVSYLVLVCVQGRESLETGAWEPLLRRRLIVELFPVPVSPKKIILRWVRESFLHVGYRWTRHAISGQTLELSDFVGITPGYVRGTRQIVNDLRPTDSGSALLRIAAALWRGDNRTGNFMHWLS